MVCAPNAFKGTLSAAAAARALALGVGDAGQRARQIPVADGGDGTLDVLLAASPGAAVERVSVHGPLGRPRQARLGWLQPGVAAVEMAEACGLRLLGGRPLRPLEATSRGAGDLIRAALDGGARRVIVGVGGSASSDGGAGILRALGCRLLDERGRDLPEGGAALARLASVDVRGCHPRLADVRLEVAVDVASPLLGERGAARQFAPQKGADPADVRLLEAGLSRFAAVAAGSFGADPGAAGAGAAGGAGFGLACLGAQLLPGAPLVCDEAGLTASALAAASLVITGEGRLDAQTAEGKAPAEVLKRASLAGVPCAAVCGSVDVALASASPVAAGVGGTGFAAIVALDSLGSDPRRHARSLLRLAARLAVTGTERGAQYTGVSHSA
ncbi:MAG: glycerate kinase family protein [Candidatus Dormibacteria bacterium]